MCIYMYLLCNDSQTKELCSPKHAGITPVRSLYFSISSSAPAFLLRVAIVASGYHCSNPSIAKLHILLTKIWQSADKSTSFFKFDPRVTKEYILDAMPSTFKTIIFGTFDRLFNFREDWVPGLFISKSVWRYLTESGTNTQLINIIYMMTWEFIRSWMRSRMFFKICRKCLLMGWLAVDSMAIVPVAKTTRAFQLSPVDSAWCLCFFLCLILLHSIQVMESTLLFSDMTYLSCLVLNCNSWIILLYFQLFPSSVHRNLRVERSKTSFLRFQSFLEAKKMTTKS